MRIGLVLGAGGTAGEAFHRGVIRAMEDAGLNPRSSDVVVGTSAGALVAASLRRHAPLQPHEVVLRSHRGPLPGRGALLALARRPRQGIHALLLRPEFTHGRRDIEFLGVGLRRAHGMGWPRAALWLVAVRRRDGHRVVFGREGAPVTEVGLAVAASCAIPGYFLPVRINDTLYVDGSVYSPTNADLLADCELDLVVVSSPLSVQPRAVRHPRIDLPIRLRFHQFLRGEVWALRRRHLRVVSIEPNTTTLGAMGLNPLNGASLDEVEERAHAQARQRMMTLMEQLNAA